MEWYDEPTEIANISNTDFLLAVDENGLDSLTNINPFNKHTHWFTVTGILFDLKYYNDIKEDIITLKNRYWEEGFFYDKRVVLHSREIRKKQGPFNPKIIDFDMFVEDMQELVSGLPIKVYSSNVNKLNHKLKYVTPFPVYELCIEYIFERFCFEMKRQRKTGTVLLESRGFKEDKLVLEKVKRLINFGNDYSNKDTFSVIDGVYFNKKRTSDNQMSYWPLEVADIYSYSIHNFVKNNVKDDFFEYFEEKIYGYPDYDGKGLKIFPK